MKKLLLLLTILLGFYAGSQAQATTSNDSLPVLQVNEKKMQKLRVEMNLTDKQVVQLAPLIAKKDSLFAALLACPTGSGAFSALKSEHDQVAAQIKAIYTPEQKLQIEAKRKERIQQQKRMLDQKGVFKKNN